MNATTPSDLGLRTPDLILASSSPRRRELFALLGLPFHAVAADVDETSGEDEPPADVAVRLALSKARTVAARFPQALIVGCDTVVALDGRTLGKPHDEVEARTILTSLRGCDHVVCSGVAMIGGGRVVTVLAETTVTMRDYANDEMEEYIASGDPFDKAGAYAVQHPTFQPVARWDGCYANVMGLPLCHVVRTLRDRHITPLADVPSACQTATGQQCLIFPTVLEARYPKPEV